MARHNPTGDFVQFLIGGCLFGAGVFLLANQVMVHSDLVVPPGTGRPMMDPQRQSLFDVSLDAGEADATLPVASAAAVELLQQGRGAQLLEAEGGAVAGGGPLGIEP